MFVCRTGLLTLALVLVLVGCVPRAPHASTQAGPDRLAPPAPDPRDRLFLASEESLMALSPSSGGIAFSVPRAVLTAEGRRLFGVEGHQSTTRLTGTDAATGKVQTEREVAGDFRLAVVSPNGLRVALVEAPSAASPFETVDRQQTTIVVLNPLSSTESARFVLDGNLEPEAFSLDNESLFVIDYLQPSAPDRYRVRRLDLQSGRVTGVQTRAKTLVEEEMRGKGRQQVLSPDRNVLYTLYVKEGDHLHARDRIEAGGTGQPSAESHAFVHVLNLAEQWAFCLDLPLPFGMGHPQSHALAVSPDGRSLYVASWASGTVAVADTQEFRLQTKPKQFVDLSGGGAAAARVGTDGRLYLAGGQRVLAIDGRSLAVVGSYRMDRAISALELGPDARRLFVAVGDQVITLDTVDGQTLASFPTPGVSAMRYVPRLAPR